MLSSYLLNIYEPNERSRFPRLRRLLIRVINIALTGLLTFSVVSGVLLAFKAFA